MVKETCTKFVVWIWMRRSHACESRQENKETHDDVDERDIENQQDNCNNNGEELGVLTHCQYKFAHLFRRWFSYHKLETTDMRMEEKYY